MSTRGIKDEVETRIVGVERELREFLDELPRYRATIEDEDSLLYIVDESIALGKGVLSDNDYDGKAKAEHLTLKAKLSLTVIKQQVKKIETARQEHIELGFDELEGYHSQRNEKQKREEESRCPKSSPWLRLLRKTEVKRKERAKQRASSSCAHGQQQQEEVGEEKEGGDFITGSRQKEGHPLLGIGQRTDASCQGGTDTEAAARHDQLDEYIRSSIDGPSTNQKEQETSSGSMTQKHYPRLGYLDANRKQNEGDSSVLAARTVIKSLKPSGTKKWGEAISKRASF